MLHPILARILAPVLLVTLLPAALAYAAHTAPVARESSPMAPVVAHWPAGTPVPAGCYLTPATGPSSSVVPRAFLVLANGGRDPVVMPAARAFRVTRVPGAAYVVGGCPR